MHTRCPGTRRRAGERLAYGQPVTAFLCSVAMCALPLLLGTLVKTCLLQAVNGLLHLGRLAGVRSRCPGVRHCAGELLAYRAPAAERQP